MQNRETLRTVNIACVIVTYNRKNLLKRCLDAVNNQTFKPSVVYITDNASTDGTIEAVKEWGYYNTFHDGIEYKYILNCKNEGGAGGFYLGMKTSFENDNYDGIWVMDDDGEPHKKCLEFLVPYLKNRDYIAPIVLAEDNHDVGFGITKPLYSEMLFKNPNGIIENTAGPFNGILYSSRLIKKIGYPKRDMFIWGDEENYHLRAIKAAMPPLTILKAIHYHPSSKQISFKYKGRNYTDIDAEWKLYCFMRNSFYNNLNYRGNKFRYCLSNFRTALLYVIAYKIVKNKNIIVLAFDAYLSSIIGNFKRLDKYMN